jgi:hypothetical protein
MGVLTSRRCISDFVRFLELAVAVEDENDDLDLILQLIGITNLLLYVEMNSQKNSIPPPIIPINNIRQYRILNQDERLFEFNFCRLTRVQASEVYRLLNLPITMTTENDYEFSLEAGFLLFLK